MQTIKINGKDVNFEINLQSVYSIADDLGVDTVEGIYEVVAKLIGNEKITPKETLKTLEIVKSVGFRMAEAAATVNGLECPYKDANHFATSVKKAVDIGKVLGIFMNEYLGFFTPDESVGELLGVESPNQNP